MGRRARSLPERKLSVGRYTEKMTRELGEEILKVPMSREEIYTAIDQIIEEFYLINHRLEALEKASKK